MVAGIGIDLEISHNRMDNFVIGALSASEDAQLPLQNQRFNVAMLLAQDINDHCALPEDRLLTIIADVA
jgi:hypothetical protein